uniref:Uncharacterized protein n=1 Tax=Hyaloperonospora arabidopsidis (strain Emoy2) TaxID=559515 RepID=M4B4P6_HYAAE
MRGYTQGVHGNFRPDVLLRTEKKRTLTAEIARDRRCRRRTMQGMDSESDGWMDGGTDERWPRAGPADGKGGKRMRWD